jgi:hypothetical protein
MEQNENEGLCGEAISPFIGKTRAGYFAVG